jgi:hypothetical protein
MKSKIIKSQLPKSTILLSTSAPIFSIIWLHGLGDSSEGF